MAWLLAWAYDFEMWDMQARGLTVEQAIRAMTTNAAWQLGVEAHRGTSRTDATPMAWAAASLCGSPRPCGARECATLRKLCR